MLRNNRNIRELYGVAKMRVRVTPRVRLSLRVTVRLAVRVRIAIIRKNKENITNRMEKNSVARS